MAGFTQDKRAAGEQMAEFDRLPNEVKAKLREAPYDISPLGLDGYPAHLAIMLIDTSCRLIRERS